MASTAKEFLIKLFLEGNTKGGDDVLLSLKNIRASLNKTAALGTKMSLLLTAPIVAMGVASIKTASDFESQMARVGAVSNATKAELSALEAQARQLGATTKFSATQAADAMAFLSMAGFKPNQTIEAMPSTLKLASAALLEVGTAADITSNILTGFGMDISDLSHVNDVLVKAMTSSNTDLTQLGEAMKYVAPTASGAGQSIEDVTAAIGALGNAGIQGSMAGTTLRGVLSELLNPSTKTSNSLKELGVNIRTSTGAMRPIIDIIAELSESGIQTSQVMEIFGDRAGPGMVALLEQGSDSLASFSDALKNSEGTADKVAKDMQNSLGGAWAQIKSAFEELQISLMNAGVFDALKALIAIAGDLLAGFNSLGDTSKKYTLAIVAMVAALGPAVLLSGKLLSGVVSLGGGLVGATKFMWNAVAGLKGMELGIFSTRTAVYALRSAIITTGIGALIVGVGFALDYVAGKITEASESVNEFSGAIDKNAQAQKRLSELGEVGTAEWSDNYKKLIDDAKSLEVQIQRLGDKETQLSNQLTQEKAHAKWAYKNESVRKYNAAREKSVSTEKKLTQATIEYHKALKQQKDSVGVVAEAKALQLEYEEKQAKLLKNEEVLLKSIENINKSISQESLSNTEKLAIRKEDLLTVEADILDLQAKRSQADDVALRIQLLESERAKIQEKRTLMAEVATLEKATLDDAKKEFQLEEAKLKAGFKEQELEILRAKASGNADLTKSLEAQLALEKLTLDLRKQGADDKTAKTQATEILSLQSKIADISKGADELRKAQAYEVFKLEMDIENARLRGNDGLARGLAIQLQAKQIQEQAIDMMEEYGIGYQDALDNLRALDALEKQRALKNDNSDSKDNPKDVQYGKTVSQIEKEQEKVKKLLASNSFSQIQRGQKQAQNFEDKYGIGVDDSARAYKGKDRKTGKLVAPTRGKEYEELEATQKEAEARQNATSPQAFARAKSLGAEKEVPASTNATIQEQKSTIEPLAQNATQTRSVENSNTKTASSGSEERASSTGVENSIPQLAKAINEVAKKIDKSNELLKDNYDVLVDINNATNAAYI